MEKIIAYSVEEVLKRVAEQEALISELEKRLSILEKRLETKLTEHLSS